MTDSYQAHLATLHSVSTGLRELGYQQAGQVGRLRTVQVPTAAFGDRKPASGEAAEACRDALAAITGKLRRHTFELTTQSENVRYVGGEYEMSDAEVAARLRQEQEFRSTPGY